MSDDTATVEVSSEIKSLGDQIADLTLKQAKELSDYLENEYDIKAAAGGAVVMAGGGYFLFGGCAAGDTGASMVFKIG